MDRKESKFTKVPLLQDSDYVRAFGQGSNIAISKPDLFKQIKDETQVFIYPTIEQLQSANLVADPDWPIYVRVEETEYRLYKITSLAPGGDDISLNNGTTATFQDEYYVQVETNAATEQEILDGVINDKIVTPLGASQTLLRTFDTPAQAALASMPVGAKYSTKGANAVGDGGEGNFIVSATAPTTEDGYSCFEHANGTFGVLQPPYNVRQFGAVGGADDTLTVQRFVDFSSVKEASAVLDRGDFNISQIVLPDNAKLILAGNTKIKRIGGSSVALIVSGGGCVINGTGTIDANKSENTGDLDTIYISGKANVRIGGVTLTNAVGDGYLVNVNGGDSVKVHRCVLSESNRGVKLFNARWCSVTRNDYINVPNYAVLGEGNSVRYGKSIKINDNTLRSSGSITFLCVVRGVWPGNIDDGSGLFFRTTAPTVGEWYDHNQPYYTDVNVNGNTWTSCPTYAIITRVDGGTIKGNIVNSCSFSAIVPQGRNLSVTGNVVKNCASVGYDFGNCAWLTANNNTAEDCDDIGIELTSVNYGSINNNVIKNCGNGTTYPLHITNGQFYSLYATAKNTVVSKNVIVCNSTNLAGINADSPLNTLQSYILEGNAVSPHSTPAVGFQDIVIGSTVNKFNLFVAGHTKNGQHWVGGSTAANATLLVNPASANANGVRVDGSATGSGVVIASFGADANIDLELATAGSGRVKTTKSIMFRPSSTDTPTANGDLVFERTSNTSLTVKLRGTDGTVRSIALSLT